MSVTPSSRHAPWLLPPPRCITTQAHSTHSCTHTQDHPTIAVQLMMVESLCWHRIIKEMNTRGNAAFPRCCTVMPQPLCKVCGIPHHHRQVCPSLVRNGNRQPPRRCFALAWRHLASSTAHKRSAATCFAAPCAQVTWRREMGWRTTEPWCPRTARDALAGHGHGPTDAHVHGRVPAACRGSSALVHRTSGPEFR